jgi:hypothetical protein
LQPVANPPLREDKLWAAGVGFEQTTEVGNMHIQDTGIVAVVGLPDTAK